MSEGLHYHMFQGVIVVNNGQFGGSSFYMPFGQTFHRQILHLHGQPLAHVFLRNLNESLIALHNEDGLTLDVVRAKIAPDKKSIY